MKLGCKILHVEDVSADAELISKELKTSGVLCDITVVDSKEGYEHALDSIRFDLILCDHLVPGFNSYKALSILKEKKLNIPFIIVTASMTEDVAMALVRDGADDYIIKDRLKRLPLAVENAVEKFRHEKDRKRLVDNLYDKETLSLELLTKLSQKILLATKVAGIGIWEFIFDEQKLIADDVMLLQFDTTSAKFDGNYESLLNRVHAKDRDHLLDNLTMHMHTGSEFSVEYRVAWPDESLHYMKTTGVVETNILGDPFRIIASNQDITSDKLSEQKIKESELRMSKAQFMAKVGSWETDLLTMDVKWSKEACRIFDIENYHEETNHANFLKYVHPEDRAFVDENFITSFDLIGDNSLEHRIITENGELKYVEECWRIKHNESGMAERAIGTIQDITVSKKASLLVLESEAKYRSIIESSMDAILLTSNTGEILAANLSACILFKMTEKELLASKRDEIVDINDPRFKSLLKERVITGRARGEHRFIRKDKSEFPGEVSLVVFLNAEGEVRVSVTIRDITNRKNAEEKLQDTANELKDALRGINNLMDSSLDVICAVTKEGYFTKVSAACETIWGYKPTELVGQSVMNFIIEEDAQATEHAISTSSKGEIVSHFENRYASKSGKIVLMEWTGKWDEGEQLLYGVGRDVTERKRLEKAYDMERNRFESLYQQAPSCMGILKGPDHVFELANPLYLQLIGRSNIIGKKLIDVMPELEGQGVLEYLAGVYNTGETFVINERLIQLHSKGTGELVDTYLNFIHQAHRNVDGEIDGIFFFGIDVTEQVISRKKIDESQKQYQQIVQTAQEGIWMVDEKEITVFVNDKMCEMFGYTKEEMLGKDMFFFMDEAGTKIARDLMIKKRAGEAGLIYHKYISKTQKEIWTQVSANPLFDEAGIYVGALAMLTDITEFKKAQDLIEESEKRYRNLFEQNLAGFYQSTLGGKIINCNDAFAKMLKYDSPEDIMSVNASALYFSQEDRTCFIANVVENKNLANYEGVSKCKDGSAVYFLENVSVHINPETGIEYFDGIIIDISEKKSAELQLKESNERFVNVGKATYDIIWERDIETGTLYLSERYSELFGYAIRNQNENFQIWSDHIHPEDQKRVFESLKEKIKTAGSSTWTSEYRYLCADGRVLHIADRGIVLVNELGQKRMVGAMQDITEKKSLENLLQKASSLATIGSWELDMANEKVYWSDTIKDILEVEKDFKPLYHSAFAFSRNEVDGELFKQNMRNAIIHGKSLDIEVNINTAQENTKWIRVIGEAEHFNGRCIRVYGSCQDINQRKISELAVINAFNEKNIILESIGDAFFAVDHDWVVTYWNSQAESILCTPKNQIIGKNLWQVFKEGIDSKSYVKYHEAMANQEVILFEDHYPALNKWYEISAYPSDNGLSIYFKDITDRKMTDEAVRASEEVRMLIMESAMDAIICINADGNITVWNPQAERIFGWREGEILGRPLSETIIPPRFRERHHKGMSKYQQTGHGPMLRKPFEIEAVNSAGQEFQIELSIVPIKQNNTEFFCAFIRDISSRKRSEERMSELHENLLEQSKKLTISNEELEKYAYVTSHDLQEPLRMVTSFLQLLQKKYESQLDDTAIKYINFAVDGADRMKTLILDLLEFSRISSVKGEHETLSLDSIVSKTLISLKPAIDESQAIVLISSFPDISGNEFQLLQLFQNLLSNAIKYKGEESPVIEIGYEETELNWQFYIKDNGIGIDPRFADKIFIIFQRLHNKKNYKGTGIGLAICKKIVELHNGRIWVEANAKGSTFYFTLAKKLPEKKLFNNLN